jgi:signal transduction histidine kinase
VPKLVVMSGEKKGVVYQVADRPIRIGRSPSNDIVLHDKSVSRKHARIIPRGQGFAIEDLGSVNGTLVNRQSVTSKELSSGDEITIGGIVLNFLPSLSSSPLSENRHDSNTADALAWDDGDSASSTVELMLSPRDVQPVAPTLKDGAPQTIRGSYRKLMVLYRILNDLVCLTDLPRVLTRALELVVDMIHADQGLIAIFDEDTLEIVQQVVRDRQGANRPKEITFSRTVARKVMETGQSILTTDAGQDARFHAADSIALQRIRSTMCVPIRHGDRVLGVIQLVAKSKLVSFSRDDLELLAAMANSAGIAIENARLFSQLRQANVELEEQQSQLIEAEKLSALGKIAGGVAHEIANPITGILGSTKLALKLLQGAEATSQSIEGTIHWLNTIDVEAHRIMQIVESLSQLYRHRESRMSPSNINMILEEALNITPFHIKAGDIQIVKEFCSNLPNVMADRAQLQVVFLNIIINALDAMAKAGTLTVTTKFESAGWVMVRIADTGCGIPPQIMGKIFKPLFTTKTEGKGTGLGLPISQDIIENHRGTLEVESGPGRGTTFIIRLPLEQAVSKESSHGEFVKGGHVH